MNDELILGVSPLMISIITSDKGHRTGGEWHPLYYRLHRKKWGRFAWKSPSSLTLGWIPPRVVIRGPSGQVLKTKQFNNYREAEECRQECLKELNMFIKSFRRHELQNMIAGSGG